VLPDLNISIFVTPLRSANSGADWGILSAGELFMMGKVSGNQSYIFPTDDRGGGLLFCQGVHLPQCLIFSLMP